MRASEKWGPGMKSFLIAIVVAMTALPLVAVNAALPENAAVGKAATFILNTQATDGGFGGFGDGQSFDAIYALRSAGIDPATVKRASNSPVDFVKAKASGQTTAAAAAKAALAARALGLDPGAVNGTDLRGVINGRYNDVTGRFAGDDFSQSIAILGLACTGGSAPGGAVGALKAAQLADGGWGFDGFSDADTAAIAIQALIAAGTPKSDGSVVKGLAYLRTTQAADGGWGFDPAASNASSTAFVLQALIALGEDVDGATYRKGVATPVGLILSQQLADGSFAGFDPGFAANQVTPALAGRTFCNAVSTPITRSVPTATATPTVTATPTPTAPVTATPSASATPTATAPASATAPKTVTSAPAPPNTGGGTRGPGSSAAPLLGGLALAVTALAALALTARRPS